MLLHRCFGRFASTACRMPLKFAANLSKMFLEIKHPEDRFMAAKQAGFEAVEVAWPYDIPIEKLKDIKQNSGLENVLLNSWSGDVSNGELGIAAVKGRQGEFKEKLELSIEYAKVLDCKKMHIMAGFNHQGTDEDLYIENVRYAANRLQQEDILTLIEPINTVVVPDYFLTTQEQGVRLIEKIKHPNVKLQLDIFHVQFMEGNITGTIKKVWPYVGHIQIAQVPSRHEPDYPGEINYAYVFKLLEEMQYDGHIGLEYVAANDTVKGLSWLKTMGFWK